MSQHARFVSIGPNVRLGLRLPAVCLLLAFGWGISNTAYAELGWQPASNYAGYIPAPCTTLESCIQAAIDWKESIPPEVGRSCNGDPALYRYHVGPYYAYSQWNLMINVRCDAAAKWGWDIQQVYWKLSETCSDGTAWPCENTYFMAVPTTPLICNDSNPCNPADGSKSEVEVDYSTTADGGLVFKRYYNSKGAYKTGAGMAAGWRHSYSRELDEAPERRPRIFYGVSSAERSNFYSSAADACTSGWDDIKAGIWSGDLATATATHPGGSTCKISAGGKTVAYIAVRRGSSWPIYTAPATIKKITRPNGATLTFELDGSDWINALDPALTLEQAGGNWVFTDTDDTTETFDSSGRLVSISYRNGQTETLIYNLSAAQGGDDDATTLDRVTGSFGHSLSFGYNTEGGLISVTTPDGTIIYGYDNHENLSSVTYPDTSTRQYLYHENNALPHQLTGIMDENGDRFATWAYDSAGRAILSERAGGQKRVEFAYNPNGTTTLTLANGASRTYDFTVQQGARKLESLSGVPCTSCPDGDTQSLTYDANGYVDEATDWNGNVTKTARNADGLITTLTEAKGTMEQRVTTYQWHPSFRLPTKITTPRNVTDYVYDTDGNPTSITVSGGGKTRAWVFTYNTHGQVLTIDGPRTDVSDVTTLAYYPCTTGAECGQLQSATNALSHVTTFDSYDASGRLTQMTDPNGLQTAFTYDSRGQVLTVTQTPTTGTARVTTMTYDAASQLKTLTAPDGRILTYSYDAAHNLSSVTDNFGNKIEYDYDAMGNLTDEDSYDPGSVLKRTMDYAYDLNNRLDTVTNGGFSTDLTLDLVGNLTGETDPNTHATQHDYDPLNRLEQTVDALSGIVSYDYDDHDNLTQVATPNGATTTFAYDQLDNLLSETSPDRGVISYTYDDAGNRLTATDARSVTATYGYDALNRPISLSYPNVAENVTFTYDHAASEGIGRLRSIGDQAGTITYTYNEFGEIVTDQRQIGAFTYTTSYQYDGAGNVSSITYPSGRTIDYGRNAVGEVTSVTSNKSSVVKTIVSSAAYEPFGPVTSLTYGNGVAFDYGHRTDYRVGTLTSAGIADQTYGYDDAGNIISIDETQGAGFSMTYGFDALDRLAAETVFSSSLSNEYANRVLADSPLGYWRLGENSGSVAVDSSGNGNDGTYVGSVALGQPGLAPGMDSAMRIDNLDGHVIGPTLSGTSFTGVEVWFNTDSVTNDRHILSLYTTNSERFVLNHRQDGTITVVDDAAGHVLSSDTPVSLGQPHHVAVWYESATNTTYMMIDGVTQQNTYAGNPFVVAGPTVQIGATGWSGVVYSRYVGSLDEVAVYDTPVNASTFSNRTLPLGVGAAVTNDFGYDSNGNRTSLDDGTSVTTLGYQTVSNRLTTIDAVAVSHDLAGNRTAEPGGVRTYTYNNAGRLSAVLDSGVTTATYVHNALGQRTTKTTGGTDIIYLYDLSGKLIAEHDATGALIRDYVWLDGVPVAQIDAGEVFSYLHFDHLGTPRLATNDSQTVVWRWDGDAFGATAADEDPDGDMNAMTINLRFPGQYYDYETGLHYNYHRTYDPATGRYLESDPIGLNGGLNTYGYVRMNPTSFTDSKGLELDYSPEFEGLIANIRTTDLGNRVLETLENSKRKYSIRSPWFGRCVAKFSPTGNGGKIVMNPTATAWVSTTDGGFTLVTSERILFHELAHAYLRDQLSGPFYGQKLDGRSVAELMVEEEQYIVDNFGNKFGDGVQRGDYESGCPVLQCK